MHNMKKAKNTDTTTESSSSKEYRICKTCGKKFTVACPQQEYCSDICWGKTNMELFSKIYSGK